MHVGTLLAHIALLHTQTQGIRSGEKTKKNLTEDVHAFFSFCSIFNKSVFTNWFPGCLNVLPLCKLLSGTRFVG